MPSSGRSLGYVGSAATKWEIEHPSWPSSTTVYRYFGSWVDAVEAAGLKPRAAARTMPLPERVHTARRLHADGMALDAIADAVGVSKPTARRYLRARPCTGCAGPVLGDGALCQPCSARAGNPRRWDRDELLALGAAWLLDTGHLPRQLDWSPAQRREDVGARARTAADQDRMGAPAQGLPVVADGATPIRHLPGSAGRRGPGEPEAELEPRHADRRHRRFEDEHQRPPLPADWRPGPARASLTPSPSPSTSEAGRRALAAADDARAPEQRPRASRRR